MTKVSKGMWLYYTACTLHNDKKPSMYLNRLPFQFSWENFLLSVLFSPFIFFFYQDIKNGVYSTICPTPPPANHNLQFSCLTLRFFLRSCVCVTCVCVYASVCVLCECVIVIAIADKSNSVPYVLRHKQSYSLRLTQAQKQHDNRNEERPRHNITVHSMKNNIATHIAHVTYYPYYY